MLIVTNDNFKTEVIESKIPVLLDAYADWCGPCRMLAPTMESLAVKYEGKIKVAKLNVDDSQDIAELYGIRSIPAVKLFNNGEVINTIVGASPIESYERMINVFFNNNETN